MTNFNRPNRKEKPKTWSRKGECPSCGNSSKHKKDCKFEYNEDKKHDKRVECAMKIIENIIEPLHFPQRGVEGERYYELEDDIIKIIKDYI